MKTNREIFFRHLAQTSDSPPAMEFISGNGCYLTDSSGRKYLDLISGISVSSYGHSNSEVADAIRKQLEEPLHVMVYGEHIVPSQTKLAEKLASLLPRSLQNIYFTNSGAEAVEGAMKVAKRFTGRTGFISFRNSYHGSTQGALSICGNENLKSAYRPLLPDHTIININNTEELKYINKNVAAVFVELVQGEAGVVEAGHEFIFNLREKCSDENVLLIFDEIQTGMGRTGSLFAFEQLNILPDIVLLGKALGAGLPLGAFISSREIMKSLSENPALGHLTTSGGNALSCAASLAGIKFLLKEDLMKDVKRKSDLFKKMLVHPSVVEVRGRGLLLAAEFGDTELNKKLIRICMKNGLLTDWFLFADTCMRIAPPLTITDAEIMKACTIILSSVEEYHHDFS